MPDVTVLVRVLSHGEGLELPAYATSGSAGVDLRAAVAESLTLLPGGRTLVPTGLALAIPLGYEGQIRMRSGLALESGLTLLNAPGTIDSDYRGELRLIMANLGSEPVTIARLDRGDLRHARAHGSRERRPRLLHPLGGSCLRHGRDRRRDRSRGRPVLALRPSRLRTARPRRGPRVPRAGDASRRRRIRRVRLRRRRRAPRDRLRPGPGGGAVRRLPSGSDDRDAGDEPRRGHAARRPLHLAPEE